ncbi:sulfur controller-2 protein [Cryphonectria parasitica EP155]|uniref:Sulfur controller-2 protein n=1 Tax=Cryphonectria parasitica (strain ATCC 38755 / EP155) TaxID=660469 RepID=A0A9P4YAK7_CRYP1|nr:sulfur controller-2 protein [Cryphonectria parasitica EP155]KAF3769495.1 sulfur controller-2 protein [Cryphonectria parasitica EP155]
MPSALVGQTVTPFLKEHVPSLYAPVSKIDASHTHDHEQPLSQNWNSKYCYRHRPDSKCRKAADEDKMAMIQTELEKLPSADQQAITHVWSLFSAAPGKHRELMIQGILSSSCFPQLSLVSREVQAQLKIDFISALPVEISFKILSHLDTVSLCKAAQVSRQWRQLADDDDVWHRMCEQHIDRQCTKCGWGLPLLERNRLRNWTRRRQLAAAQKSTESASLSLIPLSPPTLPRPNSPKVPSSPKRSLDDDEDDFASKRRCVSRSDSTAEDAVRQKRPWKDIYRDRWQIGVNWKLMRYSLKTFKGHTNGVTCLQIWDDTTLATGSYDNTIKIWNLETGEEVRTLTGHTRGIRSLQMDNHKLLSASLDGTVKIWNWRTGQCVRTLSPHSDGVISAHFQGDVMASGSIDHTIRVYNFKTGTTFCLKHHDDWVNNVKVDMVSRTLLSASDDCTIVLWDLDTREIIREFVGHVGHVQQVLGLPHDFEPDEDPAAAAAAHDSTDTMSVASGKSSSPIGGQVTDLELRATYGPGFVDNPDRPLPARYILSGGLDAGLKLWDTSTGNVVRDQWGHLEGIWSVESDSLRMVTGANDSLVKTWDPRSGRCTGTFAGHTGPVTSVAVSDALMASGSEDGEVRLYNFKLSDGCRRSTSPSTPSAS